MADVLLKTDETRERIYTASAAQTDFAVPFHYDGADAMGCRITSVDGETVSFPTFTMVPTGNYGSEDQPGVLRLDTPLTGGERVEIYGVTPLGRTTSFSQSQGNPSSKLNREFSNLEKQLQEAGAVAQRAMLARRGESLPELPPMNDMAGKIAYLMEDKSGFETIDAAGTQALANDLQSGDSMIAAVYGQLGQIADLADDDMQVSILGLGMISSDLTNISAAITAGVFSVAALTSVIAGLDARLSVAGNLSDLANVATAQQNLDVYARDQVIRVVTDAAALAALGATQLANGRRFQTAAGTVYQWDTGSSATANGFSVLTHGTEAGRFLLVPGARTRIEHSDNWAVNETDREEHDTFLSMRRWNGTAANGYHSAGSNIYAFIGYGIDNPASGTTNALTGHVNVYNVAASAENRSEIVPIAGAINFAQAASSNGCNAYMEFTASSAYDAQLGYMAAGTFLAKNHFNGNLVSATSDGLYGVDIVTSPRANGFTFEEDTGPTFPLTAMLHLSGWSGLVAADAGDHADATSAADWMVLIGGPGSVWTDHDAISKYDTAIGIRDYLLAGINIFSPHPDAILAGDHHAIITAPDAGRVRLVTPTDADFRNVSVGNGLGIVGDAASYRSLSYHTLTAMRWDIGVDNSAESGSNAGSDFYINRFADNGTFLGQPVLIKRDTGHIKMVLPTSAAGLGAGYLWVDGGIVKQV